MIRFHHDDGMPGSPKFSQWTGLFGLKVARVTKAYPLDMCCDLVFTKSGDIGGSNISNGGKGLLGFKVPVLASFAGSTRREEWVNQKGDDLSQRVSGYGSMTLPRPGDFVIVGFIDGDYGFPIIIGSIHPFFRDENITGDAVIDDDQGPSEYGVTADDERYTTVYPSMVWTKINQYGEIEISFPLGKNFSEKEGFYIKIGNSEASSEAMNLYNNAAQAKDKLEDLKEALTISDIPEVLQAVADIKAGIKTVAEAADELRKNKEVQAIMNGDPNKEEDYIGPACCCGAATAQDCTCGANWGTCSSCATENNCSPSLTTTPCSSCSTPVTCGKVGT